MTRRPGSPKSGLPIEVINAMAAISAPLLLRPSNSQRNHSGNEVFCRSLYSIADNYLTGLSAGRPVPAAAVERSQRVQKLTGNYPQTMSQAKAGLESTAASQAGYASRLSDSPESAEKTGIRSACARRLRIRHLAYNDLPRIEQRGLTQDELTRSESKTFGHKATSVRLSTSGV